MAVKDTTYADLVYIRRVVKKVPAEVMALAIGVSVETYLRSERGDRDITLLEAIKLANELEMPVTDVFPKIFALAVAKNATYNEHLA